MFRSSAIWQTTEATAVTATATATITTAVTNVDDLTTEMGKTNKKKIQAHLCKM